MKRNNKLLLSLFLFLGLILTTGLVSAANLGGLRVQKLSQDPDPASPNRLVELKIKVENTGDDYIENLTLEVMEDYPFEIYRENKINIGSLLPYQEGDYAGIYDFKVLVKKDIPPGQYDIRLKYYTNKGDSYIISNVPLDIENKEILFDIPQMTLDPENILPTERGNFKFYLKNDGTIKAKDVELEFVLPEGFGMLDSTNRRSFLQFEPNKQKEISFDYMTNPSVSPGNHEATIKLTYKNEDRTENYKKEFTFNFFIDVVNNIEKYIREENLVKDQSSELSLNIINKGTEQVKYTTVKLKNSDDYEILDGTVFIGEIDSNDYETADFEIIPKKENITLDYVVEWSDYFNEKHSEDLSEDMKADIISSQDGSNTGIIISLIFGIILTIFWIFMLIDAIQMETENKLKKNIWIGTIIITFYLGAILYFLFGRNKYR